ncbi:MAG: SLBB domain-containing protein, partial [Planctomycetota bacterium]
DLGELGRLVVAGMTLESVEANIQQIFADRDDKEAVVNVQLIQPVHRYYVIGEVNAPGAYPLVGHETVLDGIMEAGGLTARASACDLLLARPTNPCSCRVTLPVCYRAITQLGDTTTNYHLQPGDRIFVARQSFSEELTAYVSGGETCPRCCGDPNACCEPRTAELSGPEFLPPPRVHIPSVGIEGMIDEDLVESGSVGLEVPTSPGAAGTGESLQGTAEPINRGFDGELEFGDLLRK